MTMTLTDISTDVTRIDFVEVTLISPTLAAVSLPGPLHTPDPVCVVLADSDRTPVSSAGMLLAGEQTTVVSFWGRFDRCSVTRPDITGPGSADALLHLFDWAAGGAGLDCPHSDLSCVLALGGMWRWSTAIDSHLAASRSGGSATVSISGGFRSGDWAGC